MLDAMNGVLLVLIVQVIVAIGLAVYASSKASGRRSAASLADAKADARRVIERLGGQVLNLTGTDDASKQAMADASERFTAASSAIDQATTARQALLAKESALEGLYYVRAARTAMFSNLQPIIALVVAIPDALATRQAIVYARARNPRVEVVARAHSEAEEVELRQLGAMRIVVAERELGNQLVRHALRRFGVSAVRGVVSLAAVLLIVAALWAPPAPAQEVPELRITSTNYIAIDADTDVLDCTYNNQLQIGALKINKNSTKGNGTSAVANAVAGNACSGPRPSPWPTSSALFSIP